MNCRTTLTGIVKTHILFFLFCFVLYLTERFYERIERDDSASNEEKSKRKDAFTAHVSMKLGNLNKVLKPETKERAKAKAKARAEAKAKAEATNATPAVTNDEEVTDVSINNSKSSSD